MVLTPKNAFCSSMDMSSKLQKNNIMQAGFYNSMPREHAPAFEVGNFLFFFWGTKEEIQKETRHKGPEAQNLTYDISLLPIQLTKSRHKHTMQDHYNKTTASGSTKKVSFRI